MRVNIYIATSVKALKSQDGEGGYVIEAMTEKGPATVTKFGAVTGNTNRAALLVLKNALRRITTACEMAIFLDNKYVGNAIQRGWANDWQQSGWINSKGKPVADKEEWEEIAKSLDAKAFGMPLIVIGDDHPYKSWMNREIERRCENGLRKSQ